MGTIVGPFTYLFLYSFGPVLCAKPHDQSMCLSYTGAEIHYFSFYPSWVIFVGPFFLIMSKCASVSSKHWFWCYYPVLYRTYPIFFFFDSLLTIWRHFLLPSVHLHFVLFQNETLLIFLPFFMTWIWVISALSYRRGMCQYAFTLTVIL